MARTENVELTVLCLISQNDRLLLQDCRKADWHGYTPPGGHIEPGESIVEAVIREVREETGLTVLDPKLCGVKQFPISGGRYLVFLFRAERFIGTLSSSEEGEMHWVSRGELTRLSTVPDLDKMLWVMESDALTEFQYVPEKDGWKAVLR